MSNPGNLRRRVILEEANRISDSGGGASLSWSSRTVLWAQIKPLTGSESARYEGLESTITHKITLRYRADITTQMRLNMAGRIFDIRAVVNEDERCRWTICHCEEIA